MNKTTSIIIGVVLIVLAFYGGVKYEESKATSARSAFAGRGTAGGFGGTAGGFAGRGGASAAGGLTMGSILSNTNGELTISMAAGGSEIVFLNASTTVSQTTTLAPTALTTGQNVSIAGTKNSDGSVTATLIQVRQGQAGQQ